MGQITTLLSAALLLLLCSSASAQYESEDPRAEGDPRDQGTEPLEENDPRDADVIARDAEHIETFSVHKSFDALYEKGDRQALATAFGESSWELLEYINKMCEQWHQLVEQGALDDPERLAVADTLRMRCIDVSQLGDQVTGETTFFSYTDRQFHWDTEERLAFRESQEQLAQAQSLMDQATDRSSFSRALTPLERSLQTARSLGDTWGKTQALALMAEIYDANDDPDGAASIMLEGLRLGRQIHDLDTVWLALSVRYSAAVTNSLWNEAQAALEDQYTLSVELNDEQTSVQVIQRLVDLSNYVSTVGNS
ncbi:MAG: hypothetical protein ACI9EF_002323 [Pseudohongiellaceae bacterium]|jgi:hypothetical protein